MRSNLASGKILEVYALIEICQPWTQVTYIKIKI